MFDYITHNITNNIYNIYTYTFNLFNNVVSVDKYYTYLENTDSLIQYKDNVKEVLIQYKNNVKDNIIHNLLNFLTSQKLVELYSRFTLMESLLLLDGIVCSIYFLRDFFILKLSSKKLTKQAIMVYNEEIVYKYNSLYRLSTIDRYMFYLIIYFGYNIINYIYEENQYSYLLILPIVLPSIQNSIFRISLISKKLDSYIEDKNIFIRYSISKMYIHFIQHLHPQIEKIQNYHIFILYRLLSIDFIWTIINNCIFITLLNILRSHSSTYYYYKGIKMAYYYNVGYLYNVIPLSDAIYLANIIIKEKRWKELEKLEVINAFVVLVVNKYEFYSSFSGSFSVNSQMIIFQLFSLYSIISILKLITIYVSGIWICMLIISIAIYIEKLNIKNIITSLILYFLLIFNINEVIITLVILTHKIVYYILEEIYFFIKNTKNVKKVIKMYESPKGFSREAIISKLKDEYVIC
jgi:hypothetical protein